jgi:hypothetical protein
MATSLVYRNLPRIIELASADKLTPDQLRAMTVDVEDRSEEQINELIQSLLELEAVWNNERFQL